MAALACLAAVGCGVEEGDPRAAAAESVEGNDTSTGPAAVTAEPVGEATDTGVPSPTAPRAPVERPRAAVARAAPPADLVMGSVEVELKGGRYVPGEHFQVILRDGRRSFEALTDRSGEFYLEDVPAGRYVLTLSPLKGPVFHTDTVLVGAGPRVRLDHIHVQAAALPGRAGIR